MKIAVSGTHHTGKTTYLNSIFKYLADSGCRVKVLKNNAFDCPLPIREHQSFAATIWLIANCIKNEIEALSTCDILLVDRPVLDAWGYYTSAISYKYNASEEHIGIGLIKSWMTTYDCIYLSKIDAKYAYYSDNEELIYRSKIEYNISELYSNLHIITHMMDDVCLDIVLPTIK